MGNSFLDDVDLAFERITLRESQRPPPLPLARKPRTEPVSTPLATAGARWFLALDNSIESVDTAAIRDRWEKGDLTPDSLVWRPGLEAWARLSTVAELRDLIAPRPRSSDPTLITKWLNTPSPAEIRTEGEWMPTAAKEMHQLLMRVTRRGR